MDKFGIDLPPRRTLVFYVWITVAVLAVAGTIDWYASGGKTVDTIISKVFFRQSERENVNFVHRAAAVCSACSWTDTVVACFKCSGRAGLAQASGGLVISFANTR